jgi:hypothetical protein
MTKNIQYFLTEGKNPDRLDFTHEELLNEVMSNPCKNTLHDGTIDKDFFLMQQLHYKDNFLKKDLERIADYYEISKRKKKKDQLINDIILFELNPINFEITERRKTMWYYMEEILNDNYLSKFLILD